MDRVDEVGYLEAMAELLYWRLLDPKWKLDKKMITELMGCSWQSAQRLHSELEQCLAQPREEAMTGRSRAAFGTRMLRLIERFRAGERLTTEAAATLLEISVPRAWRILDRMSRPLPLTSEPDAAGKKEWAQVVWYLV
jgi:hypothetical protein